MNDEAAAAVTKAITDDTAARKDIMAVAVAGGAAPGQVAGADSQAMAARVIQNEAPSRDQNRALADLAGKGFPGLTRGAR